MSNDTYVALVTGGQGGIGKAINKCLAEDGYTVVSGDVVVDRGDNGKQDPDQAETVLMHYLDVTSMDSVDESVNFAAGQGRLKIIINCAGILRATPIDDLNEAQAKLMYDINVFGTARMTQSSARKLVEGGSIVNISSISCRIPEIGYMSMYGGTKAAIESYTRNTATDLGKRNIRVNSIAPGIIDVDMTADMRKLFEDPESPMRRVALKRMGTAEEVANAVRFLVSDQASYITGTNLLVDGGLAGY